MYPNARALNLLAMPQLANPKSLAQNSLNHLQVNKKNTFVILIQNWYFIHSALRSY
jgi:hypothetical protein